MMKQPLTLDEIKAVELDVLCKIHEICVANNIRYSLAYGTLIGAARHKGFIPWDDDIDVMMPREDYERFLEYCSKNDTPFYIITTRDDPAWPFLYTRVCDEDTVIPDDSLWKWRGRMGVFVDVLAVDGMDDNYAKACNKLRRDAIKIQLANASNWSHFFKSRIRGTWYYDVIRAGFYACGKFFTPGTLLRSVENSRKKIPFDRVAYSTTAGACGYMTKSIVESEVFEEYIDIPFENHTLRAIKDYDKFLTRNYGDYMTPPPKEKQVGHHYLVAYWKKDMEDEQNQSTENA